MDPGTPRRLSGKSPPLHAQLPRMEKGSTGTEELPRLDASSREDVPFAPGTDHATGFLLQDWPHGDAQPPRPPLCLSLM